MKLRMQIFVIYNKQTSNIRVPLFTNISEIPWNRKSPIPLMWANWGDSICIDLFLTENRITRWSQSKLLLFLLLFSPNSPCCPNGLRLHHRRLLLTCAPHTQLINPQSGILPVLKSLFPNQRRFLLPGSRLSSLQRSRQDPAPLGPRVGCPRIRLNRKQTHLPVASSTGLFCPLR